MVFEPTYALHSHLSRITGTDTVVIDRNDDFTLDPQTAVGAVIEHRPNVVFLCSPNNPTGRTETRELVTEVAQATAATSSLLVVDEAYAQFASWSAAELLDEDRAMVVTRTFSKTWSMAAMRLGYLLGPR